MTQVRLPKHLLRFIKAPSQCESSALTVADLVRELDERYPGIAAYLVHENGALRQHVNIFLDERHLSDRRNLSDQLNGVKEVVIMQALSGG